MAKKILVVDDEMDIRMFISTLLESNGYKTKMAENGEQGLQKVKNIEPDLVILDIMMPKESGIKMYRDVKCDPNLQDTPFIIVSGLARKTFLHSQKLLDKFKGQEIPQPEGYIEKPPEPEELLTEVRRIIG